MKHLLQAILSLAIISACTTARAEDFTSVYKSWDAILACQPDTVLSEVGIQIHSPFRITPKPNNKKDKVAKKILNDEALAIAVNDSVWFVNTNYLKNHYNGIVLPYLSNYAPLYFNEKVAYIQYADDVDNSFLYQLSAYLNNGMGTVDALRFITSYGFNFENAYIFTIDPNQRTVVAVNDTRMSQLLTPYLDIRRRYEAMYFYTEPFVINYYFLEYIDRILSDDSVPQLLH